MVTADGTHLLNDAGKPIYSISFSMSAETSVSTPLSNEAAARIGIRYVALNQENDLDSVERLFSQMSDYGTDRLKAFLSGWAALEILIAKSFKSYTPLMQYLRFSYNLKLGRKKGSPRLFLL